MGKLDLLRIYKGQTMVLIHVPLSARHGVSALCLSGGASLIGIFLLIGSKDRFDEAKTIDLCQNPLTVRHDTSVPAKYSFVPPPTQKEPKLVRARQIPEWEVYDAEIANFARKLVQDGKIRGGAIAASSNDLASIGTQVPTQSEEGKREANEKEVAENDSVRPGDEL